MRVITITIKWIVLWCLLSAGCATSPSTPRVTTAQSAVPAHTDETRTAVAKPMKIRSAKADPLPAPARPAAYQDLWDRIRAGFALPSFDHPYVRYYERWNQDRPEYLKQLVDRGRLYLHYIVEEVEKRGLPLEIALLPVIESAFKPNAYSRARAAGLWQFMPATGRRFGLKQNWWYDGRRDVVRSTQAALNYLETLHREFKGDWLLALAAYNAGERRVARAIAANRKRNRPTDYQSLRLKAETRRYVPKLIAFKNLVTNPKRYGLHLEPVPNRAYFTSVELKSQMDLGVVSELAGISQSEFRKLNPAFRRWATDPDGPHDILIPVHAQSSVQAGLAALPPHRYMRWTRHKIRRGESLSTIARRHGVSVRAIKTANKLRGSKIRAGNNLLIPVSQRSYTPTRVKSARSRPRRAPTSTAVVHRVRSGDTLWQIARRYDVYVKQLAHWNAIRVNDILKLGQKILIYSN